MSSSQSELDGTSDRSQGREPGRDVFEFVVDVSGGVWLLCGLIKHATGLAWPFGQNVCIHLRASLRYSDRSLAVLLPSARRMFSSA